MGRKKAYEPNVLLTRATEVFWQRGYQATSLSDLERASGVHRKSLLLEFGSKEQLFLRVMEHYVEIKAKPDGRVLAAEPLGTQNIRRFFSGIRYSDPEWGCLAALTILEKDTAPPEAYELATAVYSHLEDALLANLLPAAKAGKLAGRREARALAKFLVNALFGIVVNARAGATNADLKQVVRVILQALPESA